MPRQTRRTQIFTDSDSESREPCKSKTKPKSKLNQKAETQSESKGASCRACKSKTKTKPNSETKQNMETENQASSADSSNIEQITALTKQFSQMLEESMTAIHSQMTKMNDAHANSLSTFSSTVQELKPKKGPGFSQMPAFAGQGEDASSFLEKFFMFGKFSKWSDEEFCQAFPLALTGTAEVWYTTLDKTKIKTFADLQQLFRNRFLSSTSNWVLRQELVHRKQGANESLNEYSSDIRRRCQRLEIPLDEQLHYFIQGLRPHLKNYVILQQPKSLEEAENAARIKDSINEQNDSLTASDVLALQRTFIEQLAAGNVINKPSVAAYEPKNDSTSNTQNSERSVRRMIREELSSMNSSFNRAPPPVPRLQFNSRGDFGRANRTTNGQIICHNCKRVGHHYRNCRLPNFRQNDFRQRDFRPNAFRSDDSRSYNPRQNDPRIPFDQRNPRGGFVRSPVRAAHRDRNQSN